MPVEDRAPERFDVREFARTAVGSHRSEIDLEAFAAHPLDPGTVRLLAYLRELERSTMTYLRNVLVTPTHKDARVTAFLTTWAFEKFWIADAFEVIVRAHDFDPEEVVDLSKLRAFSLEAAERITPIVEAFRANSIGTDVIALHLASVTVDEWITEAAYTRLKTVDPHPVLVPLLDRVLEVKTRHRAFVEPEANRRLAESKGARRLSRRALPRTFFPIGASSLSKGGTDDFYASLFDRALIERIDTKVQLLPGLGTLDLVHDSRVKAHRRAARTGSALGRRLGRSAADLRHTITPAESGPTDPTKGGTNG